MPDIIPVSKKQIMDAIDESEGIVLRAARVLKISKSTLYKRIQQYDLSEAINDVRRRMVDTALDTVFNNLGDVDIALRYLTYTQRLNNTGINVNIGSDKVTVSVDTKEHKDELDNFLKQD